MPADNGLLDLHVLDSFLLDGEDVITQDDHVCQLAGGDASLLFLLKFSVGRSCGIGLYRLSYGELLLREPSVRMLAVQRGARDGGVNTLHRRKRGHEPIGAECQPDSIVQKRPERVGPAAAVMSDALLRETAIINSMVGLHGSDDSQLRETGEVFGRHMLRMLDSEATVTSAIRFHHIFEQVQDQ